MDLTWLNPDLMYFTDGSNFIGEGTRYAWVAIATPSETIWATSLPHTSVQKAELIALTKALQLGKDKTINVYTDSRYAFATAHVHGSIYQEWDLLTAEGKTSKNKQESLDLLSALWLPQRQAIIYCPGHQKGDSYKASGNKKADQAAKEVALNVAGSLIIMPDPMLSEKPEYSTKDNKDIASLLNTRVKNG